MARRPCTPRPATSGAGRSRTRRDRPPPGNSGPGGVPPEGCCAPGGRANVPTIRAASCGGGPPSRARRIEGPCGPESPAAPPSTRLEMTSSSGNGNPRPRLTVSPQGEVPLAGNDHRAAAVSRAAGSRLRAIIRNTGAEHRPGPGAVRGQSHVAGAIRVAAGPGRLGAEIRSAGRSRTLPGVRIRAVRLGRHRAGTRRSAARSRGSAYDVGPGRADA